MPCSSNSGSATSSKSSLGESVQCSASWTKKNVPALDLPGHVGGPVGEPAGLVAGAAPLADGVDDAERGAGGGGALGEEFGRELPQQGRGRRLAGAALPPGQAVLAGAAVAQGQEVAGPAPVDQHRRLRVGRGPVRLDAAPQPGRPGRGRLGQPPGLQLPQHPHQHPGHRGC